MPNIFVDKPSTFISKDSPLVILDENKYPFYFHANKEKSIKFNLPKGKYFTNQNVIKLSTFEPYEKFDKPALLYFFGYKIGYGFNPNKATINLQDKTILVDERFKTSKYKPILVFLIGHEIGHTIIGGSNKDIKTGKILFDAEKWCDDFARRLMLSMGYNPIQASLAQRMILDSKERKECLEKKINNTRRTC